MKNLDLYVGISVFAGAVVVLLLLLTAKLLGY